MPNRYEKNRERHESAEYEDFSNVEDARDTVLPEIFPEGPYGSPINKKPGKSTSWKKGQHAVSAFTYENRNLHNDNPRHYPNSHPVHSYSQKKK
ncbi:hypothetical protein [Salibacterium qingdaonense]|uniref:Cytosolic protein n=1 Tax=Salibacterium qingdaonense TaxID=266892 RepID=A0A1I4LZ14_9BACI|nr:hypothetical protein [Salibacterium qingdaonense]SFL96189.1 hypothetical protein SAMN04488054_10980 [Salibacterium qingdaonense]